ncbi:MAG: CHASE2 domain-containing protein [Candidatus Omnitrophota bacterium]
MASSRRSKLIFYLVILPLIAATVILISYLRLLDNYELETLDFRFLLRPGVSTTDKVVMVDIGEDTIAKIGRFPFDRSYHALLIKALSSAGAKSVIFDIFFSEPHENDKELADAMREAGNVYLPLVLDIDTKKAGDIFSASGYTAKTLENLRVHVRGEGQINIAPDIDGKFRRIPLYVKYKNGFYPYISFLAGCDYLGIQQKDIKILPGKYILCGPEMKIPLDDRSNMIINFSGRWGKVYKHYSYVDVLQSYLAGITGQKPILDLGVFKDKLCVVGLTAAGTVDLHPNPFETLYPGVGIHAEVFNSLISRRFITRLSREGNVAVLVFLGLLITAVTLRTKPVKGLIVLAATILTLIFAGMLVFDLSGLWIDIFYPILLMALLYLFLTIYKYINEWKKRLLLENELDIAKKIQESFLPKSVPAADGIEIASSMFTARKVGGDLYDFVDFGKREIGVMVGDVSGKGIPASLFMAMVTGKFKFFAVTKSEPKDVLTSLNSVLVKESASNLFVTMCYLIFDIDRKKLKYANGGHLPIAYVGETGKTQFLDVSEGAPLGLMENVYSGGEISFKKGDLLVLYTDGITEAMNAKHDMYGSERLAAVIEAKRFSSPKDVLNAIEKDVRKFEPRSTQHDDMTLIVIKIGEAE